MLRGKFVALNAYIRKEESFTITSIFLSWALSVAQKSCCNFCINWFSCLYLILPFHLKLPTTDELANLISLENNSQRTKHPPSAKSDMCLYYVSPHSPLKWCMYMFLCKAWNPSPSCSSIYLLSSAPSVPPVYIIPTKYEYIEESSN